MDHPAVIVAKRQKEIRSQRELACCPTLDEVAAGRSHHDIPPMKNGDSNP
jgi:hypothetical protein